ncbi:Hpt domain-containing protein [Bdellovibrio reynosensis]|uniref:Hpt domain-containing protein n=1 Tax=Bdellovibrio reynosensis TaxID=2835041 RepID=A0ABY4C590_9BACT|nr:Hpt domain-containing protein [Bdellovibrio reynosensis]UOF00125.1 Hpt domain-containing protein [Bdellovibrio reynosensis]
MSRVKVEIDADLQDLIPQFVENRKKDIATLEELVEKNDLTAISQLAHKIKGAAAGYGFNELSDLAAQMEQSAKAGDSSPLKDLVKKMRIHFLSVDIHYVTM